MNEIKPDPYFANAAKLLTELNQELAGNLGPDEAHMAETKKFERVCVVEWARLADDSFCQTCGRRGIVGEFCNYCRGE